MTGTQFDWRAKEIEQCDAALALYATRRDELNADGKVQERLAVVDEILESRKRMADLIAAEPWHG